jgi:hypothetical protein
MDKAYMSRFVRYIIAVTCLLTCSVWVHAQVLVKASVDRDKILVGEPIILTLDVRTPLGQDVTWFNLDTIPHFEFLDKGERDTIEDVDGKKWQQQLTITSYDSGYWQIPAISLKVGGKVYYSDSLGVQVGYANADLSPEYKDIKEIEEVRDTDNNYIPWIIGAFTLVALAIMIYLFRKKKAETAQPPVAVKLTPYDEAMQALKELQKKDLPGKGDVKNYYITLNDILRVFVMRKLTIASLEKTNEELIIDLKKLRLNDEYFGELAAALRMADFVKFARYQPGVKDNEKNFKVIESAIKTLNNIA